MSLKNDQLEVGGSVHVGSTGRAFFNMEYKATFWFCPDFLLVNIITSIHATVRCLA